VLGLLFNAMGVCWLLVYSCAAARGRDLLLRPRVKRTLDRLSGVILIGLATRRIGKALGVVDPRPNGADWRRRARRPARPRFVLGHTHAGE
jgi:hypothetical protein